MRSNSGAIWPQNGSGGSAKFEFIQPIGTSQDQAGARRTQCLRECLEVAPVGVIHWLPVGIEAVETELVQ
jgi:hypothetical protein